MGLVFVFWKAQAFSDPIPIEVKVGGFDSGSYHVNAVLDGQDLKFLFDTGSKHTLIQQSKPFQDYKINGFIGTRSLTGKRSKINTIVIKEFMLGKKKVRGQRVGLLRPEHPKPQLLGIDILNHLCFEISNGKKSELRLFEKCSPLPLKFKKYFGSFYIIPVRIQAETYQMIFDTGASTTLISTRLRERLKSKKLSDHVKIKDSSGVKQRKVFFELEVLRVGDREFKGTKFVFNELQSFQGRKKKPIDGILGFNVISQVNWKFDPASHTFSVSQ